VFALPEAWVWDFWLADDGQRYHLFFLYASRALGNPDLRHYRASVGHAVSTDLVHWDRVRDALVRSDPPAFDDLAIWTGSIIRRPGGSWLMFYTGATLTPDGNVQRIGAASSEDLMEWRRHPNNPLLQADPQWYEKLADGMWADEAFRDPWVLPDPGGNGWHMLITARDKNGPADDRGVIGHAWSPDLDQWTLNPPLSEPGQGFAQIEVVQTAEVDGQQILMFSALAKDMARRRAVNSTGGIWVARADSALGPYDLANAQQLTNSDRYVGRLISERGSGRTLFLAFRYDHHDGSFIGELDDPMIASWDGQRLLLEPLTGSEANGSNEATFETSGSG
jgi:sucrose-6-phosphate hydrolase SacC (GH32 family)